MKKHAYLIMAHTSFEQLEMLLKCLDFPENDIFIHIDKKVRFERDRFTSVVKQSRVFFTERVKVNWGGYSMVTATLLLLEAAVNQGNYERYHLLSGLDFPLCSQLHIHEYFDSVPELEFISGAKPLALDEQRFWDRIVYYYPFQEYFSRNNKMGRILRKCALMIQKALRVNRIRNTDKLFGVGSQFFSITDRFARYVLTQKSAIKKQFACGFCTDEMFLQWVYLHWENPNERYVSNCKDHPYIEETYFDVRRAIDWTRGKPYTYKDEDYTMLMESGCLFARKIDCNVSPDLVRRIMEKVKV